MYKKSLFVKALTLVGVATMLTACGNAKDANKSNFKSAIQDYFDTQPGLCAVIPRQELPFILPEKGLISTEPKSRADALVEAGLLSKKATEVKALFGDRMEPATEYQITEAGQKVQDNNTDSTKKNAFCTGRYTVIDVDNFTEPSAMMGATISKVNYRYKAEDVDSWAKSASMLAAYRDFEVAEQDEIKGKVVLVLTDKGWLHERLFKN